MQNRFQSYISVARKLVQAYKGEMPLAAYLKNYFSLNKKHGSTDRKQISHLCFCYCRIGKLLQHACFDERLLLAYFLCNTYSENYAFLFSEDWLKHWNEIIEKRIDFIQEKYPEIDFEQIFEYYHLVGVTDVKKFVTSHLTQPDLFIRIRPGFEKKVEAKLIDSKIPFNRIHTNCFSFSNGRRVEDVLKVNHEIVIQDYNSQQIATLMQPVKEAYRQTISIWDCCAASGGKSILAKDVFGEINLTVSDIRASIIANLKKRFDEAKIKKYQAFVADISKELIIPETFDFIISDVPCTGSGTWSRTPEQLIFFKEEMIDAFSTLQKNIAGNALKFLKKNGYFLYITCSVFKKENEDVVDHLMREFKLGLVSKKYFEGYEIKADTMFAALLKKV